MRVGLTSHTRRRTRNSALPALVNPDRAVARRPAISLQDHMPYYVAPDNDYRSIMSTPEPEPTMSVSVVMPVYNRVELMARTVAGLISQTYPRHLWDVIVGDDGSDEDVEGALAPLRDLLPITVVRQEHDGYGAGQARNLGALASTADLLVFIDADCLPDPNLIARHAAWHHKADNLVTIGSRTGVDTTGISVDVLVADGVPFSPAMAGSDDFRRTFYRRTTNLRSGDEAFRSLISSNFAIRKTFFDAVGGFDAGFHRWGGEDTELGWRLSEAGAFFVPEDGAAVFHQLQIDGEEGWRQASRIENNAEIVTRIPHRFYRKPVAGRIFLRPKISWIIAPVIDGRIENLWSTLGHQSLTDHETIWVGESAALTEFDEANQADPRVRTAATLEKALEMARGQYVATLTGWATPDRRLGARFARRLDSRPKISVATVGYQTPGSAGPIAWTNQSDIAAIDAAWTRDGFPPFTFIRRREWSKGLLVEAHPVAALAALRTWTQSVSLPDGLIALPSVEPTEALPLDYQAYQSDRSKLLEELRSHPTRAVPLLGRFARAKVGHRSFQAPPKAAPTTPSRDQPDRPHIRYVGWVGQENFGDEIMLNAVADLVNWGDVHTSGEPAGLLLLGGGTLINRGFYLERLQSKDSPRIERAVLGTGVANPSFWGITEPTDQWLDFLSTCVYVGVRGPMSAEILTDWGMKTAPEIVGDPALLLTRPIDANPTDEAVITISPARTNGELWGGDDESVFAALSDLTAQLVSDGHDVRFLSCFPADDRAIFQIMRSSGHPNLPYHAAYADPAGATRLLAESALVISERLHGAVVAAACGTPFIGLEYRPKVRDFAKSVDMEEFVLATNDLGGLGDLVSHLKSNSVGARQNMDRAVAIFRERLTTAGETIQKAMG